MTTVRCLAAARALAARRDRQQPGSPAALARRLDPSFVITPVIALLSDVARRAVVEPDQRDVVSTSPRTGKSQLLAVWTTVWALMRNPNTRIMLVSYSDGLARSHSREARMLIEQHGAFLGLELTDKTSSEQWDIKGAKGQVLAAGITGGLTGRGADLAVCDDILKNIAEADSAPQRRKIADEFRASLATRIHPGGSVVVVGTRWNKDDLIGDLLTAEPDVWRYVNVPAVAETGIPDALNREPGAVMTSAIGYTAEHYAAKRRTSGERLWYALYQGVPADPEGAVIRAEWLDQWRLLISPRNVVRIVVGVDPSDSGRRDSAGIVAAGRLTDGTVVMLADVSAPMTSAEWQRAAVDLAVKVGADEIAVESFVSAETYLRGTREELLKRNPARFIRVTRWTRPGKAQSRSAALLRDLEIGRCRLVGPFPDFEELALTWQGGEQHQPDSLTALTIAHDVLIQHGGPVTFASPLDLTRKVISDGGPDRSLIADHLAGRAPTVSRISQQHRQSVHGGGGYNPMDYPTRTITVVP